MTEAHVKYIDTSFNISTGGTVTDFGDMNFSRTKTAGKLILMVVLMRVIKEQE